MRSRRAAALVARQACRDICMNRLCIVVLSDATEATGAKNAGDSPLGTVPIHPRNEPENWGTSLRRDGMLSAANLIGWCDNATLR